MILICFGRTPGIAWHIVSFMLFMFLLSIQLIFSLSFFVCFPSFPIYMQVFLGLEPHASGEQTWISTTIPALESAFFYLFTLSCHFIPYCSMTLYVDFPLNIGTYVLCFILTMGVFSTSWWVVNQPIVMNIFPYCILHIYACLNPPF